MNRTDQIARFDELCAGRAIGDLDLHEERELIALSAELGIHPDAAFELLAAACVSRALAAAREASSTNTNALLTLMVTDGHLQLAVCHLSVPEQRVIDLTGCYISSRIYAVNR